MPTAERCAIEHNRPPRPANDNDVELMRRIVQLFTAWPFLRSRRMMAMLNGEGCRISQARAAVDAQDGYLGAGTKAQNHKAGAGTQDLPVSLALDRASSWPSIRPHLLEFVP
jgi:putative transposase